MGKRTPPRPRAALARPSTALKREQRASVERASREKDDRSADAAKEKSSIVKASLSVDPASSAVARHRVAAGESLSVIAAHYDISVASLCDSNDLKRNATLRVGQVLVLPSSAVRALSSRQKKSWHPYVRAAKNKGHIDVSTPFSHFSGPVIDSDGRLRGSGVRTLNNLLGAGGGHPALPERLIRLLVEVSDTFGGRPIRLVSGYRTNSYYQDSRHKQSAAIDFLVVGVPNAVVVDYLREFEDVGVGYYPNSSFVHMDVRNHSAYWVDYAGPGEPPRSSPNQKAPPRADRKLLAELDGLLKQTHRVLAEVRAGKAERSASERSENAEPDD
jgi:LysM repeat protein